MKPLITSVEKPTTGQKESVVTLVTDATRKATGVAFDELAGNGVLNKDNVERIRARGNNLVSKITELVKMEFANMAEFIFGCLKLISGDETLELEHTDGKATIAKSGKLFNGCLDEYFRGWGLDVKSDLTQAQKVQVHEMIKDGTFAQIFKGLNDNLDALCLTQAQIIQFVEKHRKWLHGYGTLFLFKVGDEFFVAHVYVRDGELRVNASRFGDVFVWGADRRRRVVVPQLALAN
jgi:hypothetical protein